MIESVAVPVVDMTQPGEARRAAAAMAKQLGFDETTVGRVAVVATEAATNIVKHSNGGEVLLRPLQDEGESGLELIALDKGPGITNLSESRVDGVSRSGTAGTGLGAIARMADVHDIYSLPGQGAAVLARIWQTRQSSRRPSSLEVGGVSVPKSGETTCGDGWAMTPDASGASLLVADGLGHGPDAAAASREAVRTFQKHVAEGPAAILRFVHDALRSTRGAAAAIADIDCEGEVITFAGVGNIVGTVLVDGARRNMVSHNGTLGHAARTVSEFSYPWTSTALVVLNSDGLLSHWSLDGYPGIASRDASLIAAVLYRDFTRGRDDVTVVVAKRASR